MVKNLPAMRETWVRSLGWEDPLEKGMATHSSIPAWRIPWTEETGGLQSMGSLAQKCIEVRVLKLGQDIQDEIQESGVLNRDRDF